MQFSEHLALHGPPVQNLTLRNFLGECKVDFCPYLVVTGADVKTRNAVDKRVPSPATSGKAALDAVLRNVVENLEAEKS